MQRKFFILMMLLCLTSANITAVPRLLSLDIQLTGPGDDNVGAGNQNPRGPVLAPEVYLEDNELTFDSSLVGCTVQLLDESEEVVYSTVVATGQTSITFPTTLTGNYELQIVCDGITFYCYIDL